MVSAVVGFGLAGVLFWLDPGCGPVGAEPGTVAVTVPAGANFGAVVDTLEARELVCRSRLFRLYARFKGLDTEVRSGEYRFLRGTSWSGLLRDLTEGRVVTEAMTIPEGFTLVQMAPRFAEVTGTDPDSVQARITGDSLDAHWGVPGPGLEGYLFPDTYRFAKGAPLESVVGAMVEQYKASWTPERIALRHALGMSEREVVTLASIVQAEARQVEEMPLIASVYHNRLRRSYPLQADPTVMYALGGQRTRLLYAAMDSVADHPYNTYTHPGLPPGPIGAPGLAALEATLQPADTEYMYFVARTDGTHVFSRTLAEHNRAVAESRRDWEQYRQEQRRSERAGSGPASPDRGTQ